MESPFRLATTFEPIRCCSVSPARARRSRSPTSSPIRSQKPTLILAPNKTLAAQLYGEMRELFPENAVEYFVSYYDYYQPEAYVPSSDTYIDKDAIINDADRPDAPLGDARAPVAARRHHRRERQLHLRHRQRRELPRPRHQL
jgi:hypothetical protein